MGTAHEFYPLVPLADGRILAIGGVSGELLHAVALAATDIYSPTTGLWSPGPSMAVSRSGHTATLLQNGQVLVAGGSFTGTEELYDPVTNTWSPAGGLNIHRAFHTATLLPNGQVLVAGGELETGQYTAQAELYDPETNTWQLTGVMAIERIDHTATLLLNGKVLVVGGWNGVNSYGVLASAELYNPQTGLWEPTEGLHQARLRHTATLLAFGQVLVAGGYAFTPNFEEFATAEIYDPDLGTWSAAADMPEAHSAHVAVQLSDGRVLVAGGHPHRQAAAWYDPVDNVWVPTDAMTERRQYASAIRLASGQVLVAGGDSGLINTPVHTSAELYTPLVPQLALNYSAGQPGSYIWAEGSQFPANTLATISVNGHVLTTTLPVDGSGSFSFRLSTSLAAPGYYVVRARVNPQATNSFQLDPSAPWQALEGSGPVFEVPADLGLRVTFFPQFLR